MSTSSLNYMEKALVVNWTPVLLIGEGPRGEYAVNAQDRNNSLKSVLIIIDKY